MITCTKCNKTKSTDLFSPSKRKKNGRASWCKGCTQQAERERRAQRKEQYGTVHTGSSVYQRLGVTLEDYQRRMATSDCCEICGVKEDLVYDHCHDTMQFRGVLCRKHNRAIGMLGDTVGDLERAYLYLKERSTSEH